ncbi:arylsulfatase B-like isoform X2 [Plodia interpunctella]|uniref:arylsulfatase B-like isoform X2 n=1 Tax=Plodia interpunctella TaxID=58824 RepID=UPI002368BEC5|nr:arylsulfatase B-like isoform X2 [Plodia interpunctella]
MITRGLQCSVIVVLMTTVVSLQQRPSNVVFILVDDMGWNDVSFHGSDQILTPNIDSLAYSGVILQQYYTETVCTPARTALLTGKYPMRLGMHGTPLFNSENRGIPLSERLLPSYLKELGYTTHLVGKWHVGMSRREFLPTSRGYDSHYGMRGGFVDYYNYNKIETWSDGTLMFGLDLFDDDVPQEEEQRYILDALTDRAVKIIYGHNASSPLFLHVTYNAPHSGNEGGRLQPPLYSVPKNRHIAHSDRRLFADVVTQLDRNVGQIVRALADADMFDDTIIIFASDNGAPTVGSDMTNWGVNLPLRGKKNTPWEGAVRVPAFMWHSSFRPRVWDGLMHISDWMPTLIAAAGGQLPVGIDGVNQWDAIIQDGDSKRTEVLIAVEDSPINTYAAYRAGDYKIIVGNVTGLSNGYYGEQFLRNKKAPPEYYPSLRTCDVAKTFERMGFYLNFDGVQAMRAATTLRQADNVRDTTPCIPTPTRGCLYNVRRDPSERHDLWTRAGKIAGLLTSRLRGLWAQQLRRGPTDLQQQADPAIFNYVWSPWVTTLRDMPNTRFNLTLNNTVSSNLRNITLAASINCEGTTGIRNFLCILKSVF